MWKMTPVHRNPTHEEMVLRLIRTNERTDSFEPRKERDPSSSSVVENHLLSKAHLGRSQEVAAEGF